MTKNIGINNKIITLSIVILICSISITHAAQPTITPVGSGTMLIGDARILVASGGTAPYTWSIRTVSGAPGLLSTYTGTSIAFLATIDPGTCSIIVTDNTGAANTTQNLVVIPAPVPIKSYWIWGSTVSSRSVATTVITTSSTHQVRDVFVLVKGTSGSISFTALDWLTSIAKGLNTNVRIHPWVICFNDQASGLSGNYTTYGTYTSWIKPTDPRYRQYLMDTVFIPLLRDHPDIAGIHLDYYRYSGVSSVGGLAASNDTGVSLVRFCQEIATTIRKYNAALPVSIAVMPEYPDNNNEYYYGQSYYKLSTAGCRILCPMSYSTTDATYSGKVAGYLRNTVARTCSVYAGQETGASASLVASETRYAINTGAQGVVAFRWPIPTEHWTAWDTVGTTLPITFSPSTAISIPVGSSIIFSANGGWKPFARWTTNNWSIGSVAAFFGDDSVRFYARSTGTCVITVKDSAPGPRQSNSATITVTPGVPVELSGFELTYRREHGLLEYIIDDINQVL
ncbi:MAG: hypothetical protein ACE14V_07395 [bacterium]